MWYQVKQALDQSTRLFLTRLANLLPGIVALIVALVVALILAAVIAVVVRRLLVRMNFDERLVQWGFAGVSLWSPLKSPVAFGLASARRAGYFLRLPYWSRGLRSGFDFAAGAHRVRLHSKYCWRPYRLWPPAASSPDFLLEAC